MSKTEVAPRTVSVDDMPPLEVVPVAAVPAEVPHEEQTAPEYRMLTGHYRNDRTYKTSEQLRTEYVNLTDNLVHQMTDGVLVRNRETGEMEKKAPDAVIWLDKSARPLQWLTREMWPKLAAEPDGTVPPMPKSFFLNIDKKEWGPKLDPEEVGVADVSHLSKDDIRSLRSIFVAGKDKVDPATGEDSLERVDEATASLDGKTVLIVDEVMSSGATLRYAQKLLEAAFPDTQFAHTYWMSRMTEQQGLLMNVDQPVWYNSRGEGSKIGRGVGDVHVPASEQSVSRTQRLGAAFLSTALKGGDPTSRQLRAELQQLAHDPDVLIQPSRKRDEEDQDERIARLNGTDARTAYARLRELRNQH